MVNNIRTGNADPGTTLGRTGFSFSVHHGLSSPSAMASCNAAPDTMTCFDKFVRSCWPEDMEDESIGMVLPSASGFKSPLHIEAIALHHGMQMVADLGAAAVEVESDSTLALAALRQKEQDYCVFGLIYFMMARLRYNAIVHCACERDGRPTRLRIETLQSHSQHRRSSYSLTAPEEDAVEKRMILLYQILMENGLEQAFMFRNFLDTSKSKIQRKVRIITVCSSLNKRRAENMKGKD
ncbi:hypothetical protein D8674_022980 [Pyrus ussuriensis x Pyrus communis]|uniref:Uncharacterized protein n=1 Tax=Pyrus ussuriensis x Pyrus communis TaxID=2448454 RepID=A0A5N5GRW3_9ROSA|nr:hypothetical protein D8674_022980 [Pyrus ussuriensis x Pyrus communis]